MIKSKIAKYQRGLILFIIISAMTFVLLSVLNEISIDKLREGLSRFNLIYAIPAVLLLLLHIVADCFRLFILARGVEADMKFSTAWKANLANEFLSAVTPFQSGGQPFEIYIFHKNNISLGKSVVISYFKTATSVFFLFSTGFTSLFFYTELTNLSYLNFFYVYGTLFMLYFATVSYLTVFKPNFAKKLSYNGMRLLKYVRIIKRDSFFKKVKFIMREVNSFNYYIRNFFFNRKKIIALATLATFAVWIIKYLIGYCIVLGFGISTSFIDILLFQSVIHFVNYSIPTPGASGSSEAVAYGIFGLLSDALVNEKLYLFVVLWRFFSYYILIALAGIVTFKIIKERLMEKQPVKH